MGKEGVGEKGSDQNKFFAYHGVLSQVPKCHVLKTACDGYFVSLVKD